MTAAGPGCAVGFDLWAEGDADEATGERLWQCGRPHFREGLCEQHYRQQDEDEPFTSFDEFDPEQLPEDK